MKKQPSILIIGSINIDLVIQDVEKLPKWGESAFGKSYQITLGGKGANQAIAVSKMGAQSYIVGRIGKDENGQKAIHELQSHGVNTNFIHIADKECTGISTMNIGQDGRYFSVNALGANMSLTADDFETALSTHKFDLVMMQLEMPMETAYQIYELASKYHVPVFLDIGRSDKVSLHRFKGVFIISPNEAEAEALTGITLTSVSSIEKAAKTLYDEVSPKYVLIKLGSRGAFLYCNKFQQLIPSFEVNAIDSTAAGDTFGAALSVKLFTGSQIEDAILFGNAAAALCVTKKGGAPSIPSLTEAEAFHCKEK